VSPAVMITYDQDDRIAGEKIMKGLRGIIVGDKGYISKELFNRLFSNGLRMVTSLRKKNETADCKPRR
jgi:hypothetical protein